MKHSFFPKCLRYRRTELAGIANSRVVNAGLRFLLGKLIGLNALLFLSIFVQEGTYGADNHLTFAFQSGPATFFVLYPGGSVYSYGTNGFGESEGPLSSVHSSHVSITNASQVLLTNMVSAVSGGYYEVSSVYDCGFSLALGSNGKAWAFGLDLYGQLGDNSSNNSKNYAVGVNNLSNVVSVSAGGYHSVALTSNGKVWTFGHGGLGQIGDGLTNQFNVLPVSVPSLSNMLAIAAGKYHTIGLKVDGTVWTWGRNYRGQLGIGYASTNNQITPLQIAGLTNVVGVSAGTWDCFAVTEDGRLFGWGFNDSGQLGLGITGTNVVPAQVIGLTNVVLASGGDYHSLALQADGSAWAMGTNTSGQLGIVASTNNSLIPVPVSISKSVVSVSAGGAHSTALDSMGNLWVWGHNVHGEAGHGPPFLASNGVPVLKALPNISLDTDNHSLFLKFDGTVLSSGFNASGQLGDGTTTNHSSPQIVKLLRDVAAVNAGGSHSLAVKLDGTVWAWGGNNYGQLGDNTFTNQLLPVQVFGLSNCFAVSAGSHCSLSIGDGGKVWAWGDNNYGQLGDGSTILRSRPFCISSLSNITAIASGGQHTMALQTNGLVWSWGANIAGQLGKGDQTNCPNPMMVGGLTGVVAISAGDSHSLALKADGTVWAWGYNGYGQLGQGTTVLSTTPVQVSGISQIVAIACGANFSLALGNNGLVWAWGYNGYGQLGDGTGVNHHSPIQVPGISSVRSIQAGENHVIATLNDGSITSWGDNQGGQLGDGLSQNQNVPMVSGFRLGMASYTPFTPSALAHIGRFSRGAGTNQAYLSFVIPIDGQMGIAFSDLGNTATNLFSASLWSNSLFHYNGTNSASSTNIGLRIPYQQPIAAFGGRLGASPLYIGQNYNFGIYAGDPDIHHTNALLITIINRTTMLRVGAISMPIPSPSDTNDWSNFLKSGNSRTVSLFGLSTTLSLNGAEAEWGVGHYPAYQITHNADENALGNIYQVSLIGRTDQGWLVVDTNGVTQASDLYTVEFESCPAWRSAFINQPHFNGEPLPPFYDGYTLTELLTNSAVVTNQLSLPLPLASYTNLDQSPELIHHSILDNFVANLGNDPLALANYVINEIDLTDALSFSDGTIPGSDAVITQGGMARNALDTFQEGRGSPTEQCALLVYLLRKAGIPAVYVYPTGNGLKMLDARMSKLLRLQLKGLVNDQGQTNIPSLIPVNYPWVAAYVDTNWVHIFPWLKDTDMVEGLNLYDYMPNGYESGYKWVRKFIFADPTIMGLSTENDTPSVLFPKFLQKSLLNNWPGISVDDIGSRIHNRRHYYNKWSDFPTPTVVTNAVVPVESMANITNGLPGMTNIFDLINIQVSSKQNPSNMISTGDMRIMDLHNRQLLLWYTTNHDMVLSLESFQASNTNRVSFSSLNQNLYTDTNILCNVVQTNTLTGADQDIMISITEKRHRLLPDSFTTNPPPHWSVFGGFSQIQPDSSTRTVNQTRSLRKGDLAAICFSFGAVSSKMLELHAQKFWQTQQAVVANSSYTNKLYAENFEGTLTYLMGMDYFSRIDRFNEASAQLHKVQTVSWNAAALSILKAQRNTNGLLANGKITYIRPAMDVFYQQVGYAGNGTVRPDLGADRSMATDDFYQLAMANASAEEHATINSYFMQPYAVSAVRLLQKAQTNSNPSNPGIVELNVNNYAAAGTTIYKGKQLRAWDPGVWAAVTNTFNMSYVSNLATVFITPGAISNATGSEVGAMILAPNYFSSLMSENLNGSQGPDLSPSFFDVTSMASLTLSEDPEASPPPDQANPAAPPPVTDLSAEFHYTPPVDWHLQPSAFLSGGGGGPTPFFPTQFDITKTQSYLNSLQNENTLLSKFQAQATADYLNRLYGKPTLYTPANMSSVDQASYYRFKLNSGDSGPASNQKDVMKHVADPVNVVNGEFYIDAVDLTLAGPIPMQVRRNYGSRNTANNEFGYGWKLAYFPYLVISTNEALIYAAEMDGSVICYSLTNGLWRPDLKNNPLLNNGGGEGAGSKANYFNGFIAKAIDLAGKTNFTLHAPDGGVRSFQVRSYPVGGLTRTRPYLNTWTDSQGNFCTFEFGENLTDADYGLLKRIQSSNGGALGFYYDILGHITEAYSQDGRRLAYTYDNQGDLTNVRLPDQSEIAYSYQHFAVTNYVYTPVYGWYMTVEPVYHPPEYIDPFYVTQAQYVYDGWTMQWVWQYVTVNQPYWQNDYWSYDDTMVYGILNTNISQNVIGGNSSHLLQSEAKPEGRLLINAYDDQYRVTNQWSTVGDDLNPVSNATFQYQSNFNITNSPTNLVTGTTLVMDVFGNTNRYEYTNSLITRVVDPYGFALTQTWFLVTDAHGGYQRSLKQTIDKRGLVKSYVYDASGNVITNIVSGVDLDNSGSSNAVFTFTYDTNNLPLVLVDPVGTKTMIRYDPVFAYLPAGVGVFDTNNSLLSSNLFVYGSVSNVLAYATNIACGLLQREITAAGSLDASTNDILWDGRGFVLARLSYTTDPNECITNSYVVNNRGEIVESLVNGSQKAKRNYDEMGRLIGRERFDTDGQTPLSSEFVYYDENGQVNWYDGPRSNPEDYIWFDYDGAGRRTQEIHWRSRAKMDGSGVEAEQGDNLYATTFYEYDAFGNLTSESNQLGNSARMEYDALGRMVEKRHFASDQMAPLSVEGFGYEPGGNVAAYTNALGGVTLRSFTTTGLIKQQIGPDGRTNAWTYYVDGKLKREYMPNGSYQELFYDDVNSTVARVFNSPVGVALYTNSVQFDKRGNAVTNVDAEGYVFVGIYDQINRKKVFIGPANGSVRQTFTNYYADGGLSVTNVNGAGERTVLLRDPISRPFLLEVASGTNVIEHQSFTYSSDNQSMTLTSGSGSNAIISTSFIDTFGMPILKKAFTNGTNFVSKTYGYDVLERLIFSADELNQVTSFEYDGLNRLNKESLPGGAQTSFQYDAEGNLTNRVMPGGLTWSAKYDLGNRIVYEQDSGGVLTARTNVYAYYSNGSFAGLLQSLVDSRGVGTTYLYDNYLRIANVDSGGPLPEHRLHSVLQYDRRSLLTSFEQYADDPAVQPETMVLRGYDGYGQIISETVQSNAIPIRQMNQTWNSAGRRSSLIVAGPGSNFIYTNVYRADGHLTGIMAGGQAYNFTYSDNGLLTSRSNSWRTVDAIQRDGLGRIQQLTTSVGGTPALVETIHWRANSTLNDYTAVRSDFTDARNYSYNSRGQLLAESFAPQASQIATETYTFDQNQVGVMISAVQSGALTNSWRSGPLDGLYRVQSESNRIGQLNVHSTGKALGAGSVSLVLDGGLLGNANFTPGSTDGLWSGDLALSPGAHTLTATAHHPLGTFNSNATNVFNVTGTNTITTVYDGDGNVIGRTFTTNHAQTLSWDGSGRLRAITDQTGASTNYVWKAVYDGLGRRLQTIHMPVLNGTNAPSLTLDSWYDPEVEFLEVAVGVNGQRTFKVYGPDSSGVYGGAQGICGLEATIRESDGVAKGIVNDQFGNGLATISGSQLTWNGTKLNGYGPVQGFQAPALSPNISLADVSLWQGRRIDSTGYYYQGARYYDPTAGRFLSADPFGHAACIDLYSYAGGDPVNNFDPDGRLIKETGKKAIDFGGNAITGFADVVDPVPSQLRAPLSNPNTWPGYYGRKAGEGIGLGYSFYQIFQGGGMMFGGGGLAISGGTVELATVGGATPVAVPAAVVGGAVFAGGAVITTTGVIGVNNYWVNQTKKPSDNSGQNSSTPKSDKLPRYDGPKPEYEVNPAHVPGPTFVKGKTPLPADALEVYKNAVPGRPDGFPKSWFGKNAAGQIYRYGVNNNNQAHFNGIEGVGQSIKVPQYARDRLDKL
jgi:RHS repeat-associated protein